MVCLWWVSWLLEYSCWLVLWPLVTVNFFLQKTLAVNEKDLCKYFEPGNHVKVVSGTQEGATGMVVKVEQHVLIILSDTTKEHVSVFFLLSRTSWIAGIGLYWNSNLEITWLILGSSSVYLLMMLWRVLKWHLGSPKLGTMSFMILCYWSKFFVCVFTCHLFYQSFCLHFYKVYDINLLWF